MREWGGGGEGKRMGGVREWGDGMGRRGVRVRKWGGGV